ncbi:LacI family DNA-binding transcriptional regulator [Schaalia sp. Marseille-Q2122]|uniref:LacI family DNA-binding transcriptional regulator n=1 Tax=Schaalia sp. Marseille-Q2122 TaxID=2736604 RepID=UPI00158B7405|nr:LacI family DNA-binding transcriptional regulator [Schaalia sp. Marseille-Q2122]
MAKPRTRLMDIAQHAGVSTATVSRVINRTGPVSSDTRHRVLTAIDRLGYERPASERSGAAMLIGIITPELINPIFATYAHAIQSEVARADALPVICSQTPGATSEGDHVEKLLDQGVSGIIFLSGRHADYRGDLSRYQRLHDKGIPFVTINGARDEVPAPDFSTGDGMGIEAAVHHLRELGHTRIALLTGQTHMVPAARKVEAFRHVMKQLFGEVHPVIVETFYTYEAAATATEDLINQGVTAIVTGSDLQALGAIRTIKNRGLDVPGDISVVGFDDSMLMAHLDPPLTTVRQPVAAITNAAVQALFAQLHNSTVHRGAFIYTPDLIVRASTGACPR